MTAQQLIKLLQPRQPLQLTGGQPAVLMTLTDYQQLINQQINVNTTINDIVTTQLIQIGQLKRNAFIDLGFGLLMTTWNKIIPQQSAPHAWLTLIGLMLYYQHRALTITNFRQLNQTPPKILFQQAIALAPKQPTYQSNVKLLISLLQPGLKRDQVDLNHAGQTVLKSLGASC